MEQHKDKVNRIMEVLQPTLPDFNNSDIKYFITDTDGWVRINIFAGENVKIKKGEEKNLGRIYLNIDPEIMTAVFYILTQKGINKKANFRMKFPNDSSERSFNRSDKIVLYFEPEDTDIVKSIIEEVYNERSFYFQDSSPKFTQPLMNYDNKPMKGVSFGQEPTNNTNDTESFGGIRAKILTPIAQEILSGNIDEESMKNKFQRLCIHFGVDPNNLAFNNNSNTFDNFKSN